MYFFEFLFIFLFEKKLKMTDFSFDIKTLENLLNEPKDESSDEEDKVKNLLVIFNA